MASRGQKRIERVEELPADKRACNSLEFRPSSSNSSVHTPMSSPREAHDADMETSSSTSGSARSEGDGEKESTYSSCDSDRSLHDHYRNRSINDQSKFKKLLSSLSEEADESGQLALLTELCELLSFCNDSSVSSLLVDTLSPILVRLARHEGSPDIMLLSIRAITYLCDVNPRSSGFLVRHDAVPVLCQRLMAIEYLDVAEQCLQALEKISHEQPLACLQSGGIMAVLSYIDFFSTSVQRVALSTVVNICKKLSSESPSLFMEAIPTLCNLLQYEDRQLVESAATCLIRIGEQLYSSPDKLDEFCEHGLVQHTVHLMGLNSRTTLCQPTYVGLIGLLVNLAAGSHVAFRTLLELNISSVVKDMLSTNDLAHGTQITPFAEGHRSQMNEVLKLLNELLPTITAEQDGQQKSEKEDFLLKHSDITHKFGVDILPILIEVVNSGANLFTCYSCLSIINKLVHFNTADALQSLLPTANFSSFLAGVFTRKDHHVVSLALHIVDAVMLKLPHDFINSFIKEGIMFSIHALLAPDNSLKLSPVFDGMQLENDATLRSAYPGGQKCPCFAFEMGPCKKSSENGTCKLKKEPVPDLAKRVWKTYFETESVHPAKGVTCILQKLGTLAGALTALVDTALDNTDPSQQEPEFYDCLHQIVEELSVKDSISTFEFIESGIIKALVNYMCNGGNLVEEGNNASNHICVMEKRFELFGRLLLSCADLAQEETPLLILVRRLQKALSSVEDFPVISSHTCKRRNSYATVPYGRCTSYPCLKVQFVREIGEVCLREYTEDVVNVDPFLPLDTIEGYLSPRVSNGKTKNSVSKDSKEKDNLRSQSPSDSGSFEGKSGDTIVSTEMHIDGHKLQEGNSRVSLSSTAEASTSAQETVPANDLVHEEEHKTLQEDGVTNMGPDQSSDGENTASKLLFYLEGQQLNSKLTLYQSILNQQAEYEHGLWNRVHKITYRRLVTTKQSDLRHCSDGPQFSCLSKRPSFVQYTPFSSCLYISKDDFEKWGPTYDILSVLKSLEGINRLRFQLMSSKRTSEFAEGRTNDLDKLNVAIYEVPQNEFVNKKLTEKLEQQMRDSMTVSVGAMPAWCTQLMAWCPFLFGFEARSKYFHLAALGRLPTQTQTLSRGDIGIFRGRQQSIENLLKKKVLVDRNRILESAAQMMELHAHKKVTLEVEYSEEVGTGLGPTLEFYTLVCHEFQRSGLSMWRGDSVSHDCTTELDAENSGLLVSPFGLFPCPWSPSTSSSTAYSEVIKKFALLGQIVAKALQDGRVLDLPFSKAFYKLILGKELTVYDIQSFDPATGKALLEFHAVVEREEHLRSQCGGIQDLDVCLRGTKIENLCLDFTLPGYPDYVLVSASDSKMVNLGNLEEYVTLVVDATVKSGISGQVEAFKSGFDQVFPIRHLKVFTEEELERVLCGDHVLWNSDELLDHIKFDHGYTVSSPPIVNLLEIMQEFNRDQQRAFLQFVTGAPRLPIGGLASLNPKLTIVRKHCNKGIDDDLPSVMTCANYLKLPPYSSKEIMREKLLYAITEGQGSFHLS